MEETQEVKTPKKRTQPTTNGVETSAYSDIKEMGIPVKTAVFHRAINAGPGVGTPDFALYTSGTNVSSRLATMWYTPHGLICEQKGNKRRIVPLANIVYVEPA